MIAKRVDVFLVQLTIYIQITPGAKGTLIILTFTIGKQHNGFEALLRS